MSHFAVLVIGADPAKQLQPFHEFECTGQDDEFVQDIDKTDEQREEFASASRSMVRLADGTEVGAYSEHWGDGLGYRTKVRALPEGAIAFEQLFATFADYLRYSHDDDFIVPFGEEPDLSKRHKYGYALTGEDGEIVKVIRRTNPNKKWDWWKVGGRWSGFFKLKPGAKGVRGDRGLLGSSRNEGEGFADQVLKGDIDIAAMQDEAGIKAGQEWDKVRAITGDLSDFATWDECREQHKGDFEAARKRYREQPARIALTKAAERDRSIGFMTEIEPFMASRDQYIERARASVCTPFAVLKDGKWYEKGEMGWWACVANEKKQGEWNAEVAALIFGLPDDTLLTLVDCHI